MMYSGCKKSECVLEEVEMKSNERETHEYLRVHPKKEIRKMQMAGILIWENVNNRERRKRGQSRPSRPDAHLTAVHKNSFLFSGTSTTIAIFNTSEQSGAFNHKDGSWASEP
jgi:hypothetical protein